MWNQFQNFRTSMEAQQREIQTQTLLLKDKSPSDVRIPQLENQTQALLHAQSQVHGALQQQVQQVSAVVGGQHVKNQQLSDKLDDTNEGVARGLKAMGINVSSKEITKDLRKVLKGTLPPMEWAERGTSKSKRAYLASQGYQNQSNEQDENSRQQREDAREDLGESQESKIPFTKERFEQERRNLQDTLADTTGTVGKVQGEVQRLESV
jgi:hypothetical protein